MPTKPARRRAPACRARTAWLRVGLGVLFLVAAAAARAGQADLALTTAVSPAGPYFPGQTVQITFTVTNLGPSIAGANAPVSPPPYSPVQVFSIVRVNDAYRIPLLIYQVPGGCAIEYINYDPTPVPGDREGYIYVIYFPPLLQVGELRSCTVDAYIDLSQTTTTEATWRATSQGDVDPNPANSSSTTVFGIAAVSIPSTSRLGLWVLALGALLMAWSNQRGRV